MLFLVICESEIETIPPEISSHPTIMRHGKKRRKNPKDMLLDSSRHYKAMRKLEEADKRGRPDIVFITLLTLLDTPLNHEGLLRTYVHTRNEEVIYINPKTRLPRDYFRFIGLMEQLFKFKRVPLTNEPLLTLKKETLSELLEHLNPNKRIGLSIEGTPIETKDLFKNIDRKEKICVLVGGFPHGHFKEKTKKILDEIYRIDKESLCTWTVANLVVYAYSEAIGLKRV